MYITVTNVMYVTVSAFVTMLVQNQYSIVQLVKYGTVSAIVKERDY